MNAARLAQLAWFGGVALLFVTLIFPIQFEKQWLSVAWALEGAALCWLLQAPAGSEVVNLGKDGSGRGGGGGLAAND